MPVIRRAAPSDYHYISRVMDEWWGGRRMRRMLPRLFFVHFQDTVFVAEEDGRPVAFLAGFLSQSFPDEAYIHFVGVHPDRRDSGLGRSLYEAFFEAVKQSGRRIVRSVTSPVNTASIAFHTRLGFEIEPQESGIDGLPVRREYDGPGEDRVLFVKRLAGRSGRPDGA